MQILCIDRIILKNCGYKCTLFKEEFSLETRPWLLGKKTCKYAEDKASQKSFTLWTKPNIFALCIKILETCLQFFVYFDLGYVCKALLWSAKYLLGKYSLKIRHWCWKFSLLFPWNDLKVKTMAIYFRFTEKIHPEDI